jgi:hypothetical protein
MGLDLDYIDGQRPLDENEKSGFNSTRKYCLIQ